MKLFNLIQLRRGKRTIVMTDALPVVNKRMATLRKSQRTGIKGEKVIYFTELADDNIKFSKSPHKYNIGGGDAKIPRVQ